MLLGVVLALGLPALSIIFPEMRREIVVGIDLGTTYSVIGVCHRGEVHIVDLGEVGKTSSSYLMPSWVTFLPDGVLVGQQAKDASVSHARDTLYDTKRLIGRAFADPVVQDELSTYPFEVLEETEAAESNEYIEPLASTPVLRVGEGASEQRVSPTRVATILLSEMKTRLEKWLYWRKRFGWSLKKATVSVPANFDAHQRLATLEAGRQAGLTTVQLITEPAAAALAYRLDKVKGVGYVVIFDFGGGTLDVALLLLDKDIFQVIATAGDPHLGGEDVDRALTEHFANVFKQQTSLELPCQAHLSSAPSTHLLQECAAMSTLRRAAESVKVQLSNQTEVSLKLPNLHAGKGLDLTMTRTELDVILAPLVARTLVPVQQVLTASGTALSEVSDLVLVGGSSRIPLIRESLKEFFAGFPTNIRHDIDPDQAVARGATLTTVCG